jgi:hypothetical protein
MNQSPDTDLNRNIKHALRAAATMKLTNDLGFAKKRHWWLRSHNGVVPCASCGFFESLAEAQKAPSDFQPLRAIIHVREV